MGETIRIDEGQDIDIEMFDKQGESVAIIKGTDVFRHLIYGMLIDEDTINELKKGSKLGKTIQVGGKTGKIVSCRWFTFQNVGEVTNFEIEPYTLIAGIKYKITVK